jgi:ABC-type Zn uptake system ZnuABC Zn-binding protein ZnuA
MMQVRRADVFFLIGMRFELWSQQIIDGSRNADLTVVDCSDGIQKLEVPTGRVDARHGDVHPYGNPHYWLDPSNVPVILNTIVRSLSRLSPRDAAAFESNARSYTVVLLAKLSGWKRRMKPFEGKEIVTYHTTFSYFVHRFGIAVAGYIEPKPGIPPTPVHISDLMNLMRKHGITVIGLEQYFEESVPNAVASAVDGTVIRLVSSVGGSEDATSYIALIEHNIRELEIAFAANGMQPR